MRVKRGGESEVGGGFEGVWIIRKKAWAGLGN